MAGTECYKCEVEIDDENYFECDGCTTTFHLKCVGISKQEYNAREKSKRMRLLCDDCNTNSSLSNIERNVATIMKYIHKFDLLFQNRKLEHAKLESTIMHHAGETKSALQEMRNEIKVITECLNGTIENTNHVSPACTNVGAVKSAILPTVCVKPKNGKQLCEATLQRVKENIVGSEALVRDTQNIRGGGIVISCVNAADTVKMKQLIDSNIGNEYDTNLPEIKKTQSKNIKNQCEYD